MRVLETKSGSSSRAASACHCWATSPAPFPVSFHLTVLIYVESCLGVGVQGLTEGFPSF